MDEHQALFLAWQEADHQARRAERDLYQRICAEACRAPVATDSELDQVRALRGRSTSLMRRMLAAMERTAASLQ